MSYNSLRDRHGSSIGGAPIGFVKAGPGEYRSRDDLWAIKHRYVRGWQAHHEWRVTAPDGSLFDRYTHGHYYCTLSDAVQAVNEAVAYGVICMLRNLYARLREEEVASSERTANQKLRCDREARVYITLVAHDINRIFAGKLASEIVDRLFTERAS